MRLSWVIKEDESGVLHLLEYLFGHGDMLNEWVEYIVDQDDVLIRFAVDIIVVDHFAAYYAEWYCCFLVTNNSVKYEGTPRDNLRVTSQLRQSL